MPDLQTPTPAVSFEVDGDASKRHSNNSVARRWSGFQRRFSSATDFQGIAHVIHSFSLRGQIFWFFVLLICLALAANAIFDTVGAYLRQDLVTNIDVRENSTIEFPEATFCTTITPSEFEWYDNFSLSDASFVRDFLKKNDKLIRALGFTKRGKIPQNFNSTELAGSSEIDRKRIVFLAIGLVLSVTKVENRNFLSNVPENFTKFGFVNRDNFYPNMSTMAAIVETYKYYIQNHVEIRDLVGPAVQWLCKHLDVTVRHLLPQDASGRRKEQMFSVCDQEVLWLAPLPLLGLQSAMCLRMPPGVFNFSLEAANYLRTIHIGYTPNGVYKESPLVNKSVFLFVDLEGHRACSPYSRSCRGFPWMYSAHQLRIGSSYNFLSREKEKCGDVEKTVCLANCRRNFVQKQCNCWPLTYDWNSTVEPLCGSEPNITKLDTDVPQLSEPACVNNISLRWYEADCEKECVHRCYFTQIIWEEEEYPSYAKKELNHHNVVLRLREFTYPNISQSLDMDLREFLSQLGGSFVLGIALWTFLALTGIMFFPFCTYMCGGGGKKTKLNAVPRKGDAVEDKLHELSSIVETLVKEREHDKEEIRSLKQSLEQLKQQKSE